MENHPRPSKDPDAGSDLPHNLMYDKISILEKRNAELREKIRQFEVDKRDADNLKIRYERELRKVKSEIEHLKTPPLVVGTITDVVNRDMAVVRSSAGPQFLVKASNLIKPEQLKPGVRCTLNQQSLAIIDLLPCAYDAHIRGTEVIEAPQETYDDIGGLEKQIEEIREAVELPLTNPELFRDLGVSPPKGVLLQGSPGTGKTLLARAVAHETNATFLRVIGSELVQKYIGEGARLVRELFDMAEQKVPSIIFIDEIDAIGAYRSDSSTSGDREVQRTLMQLLAEMDGFDNRGEVRIIGATNRIDILDQALLRPGRFDRIIEIPLPDLEGRISILKIHTRDMSLDEDVDLEAVARLTEEKNGADLWAICTEAGMFAIRARRNTVRHDDFLNAIRKVSADFGLHRIGTSYGAMFA